MRGTLSCRQEKRGREICIERLILYARFLLYKYIVTKLRCLKILQILQIEILAPIAKDVPD